MMAERGNGGIPYVEQKKIGNTIPCRVFCCVRGADSRFVFRPVGGKNVVSYLPGVVGKQ